MTPNELTPDLAAFIEAQTSIFLATASANGQPHIQHRGPPEFLRVLDRVLDDKTPGNGDRGSQRLRSRRNNTPFVRKPQQKLTPVVASGSIRLCCWH